MPMPTTNGLGRQFFSKQAYICTHFQRKEDPPPVACIPNHASRTTLLESRFPNHASRTTLPNTCFPIHASQYTHSVSCIPIRVSWFTHQGWGVRDEGFIVSSYHDTLMRYALPCFGLETRWSDVASHLDWPDSLIPWFPDSLNPASNRANRANPDKRTRVRSESLLSFCGHSIEKLLQRDPERFAVSLNSVSCIAEPVLYREGERIY